MSAWATRIALLATTGAAFLVLLLYAPALAAPFLVPKLAALGLLASLAVVAFGLHRAGGGLSRWSSEVAVGAWLVAATTLLSWGAATRAEPGAPYAVAAVARWASLFGLACGASVLPDAFARRRVLQTVTIAAGLVAALGLLQHVGLLPLAIPVISTPGSTFGNRNLAAEVIALSLPLGIAVSLDVSRRGLGDVMRLAMVLEVLFLAVTRTRGAWLGAAGGLACALWLTRQSWSGRQRLVGCGVIVVAAIVAALPARFNAHDSGDAKRYSGVLSVVEGAFDPHATALRTRLGLWRRTSAMIADHAWVGVGPGNWPVVFPRYAEPDATRDGVLSPTLAPRQAHDDLLERAAETGLAGALALVLLVVGVARAVRHRLKEEDAAGRTITASAAGSLLALLLVSIASFPLEMPGTLALAGISLGLVAACPVRRERQDRGRLRGRQALGGLSAAFGVACVGFVTVQTVHEVRASRGLAVAEHALRHDHGTAGAEAALDAFAGAQAGAAPSVRFLADLRSAQMWLREKQPAKAAFSAHRALSIEPYSPNALATLAAADEAAGDHAAARREATAALDVLRDYPYALSVRAAAEDGQLDGDAARRDRERIRELARSGDDEARRAAETLTP